jgi:hypothetical protein
MQPHPAASKPNKQGVGVPWMSGTINVDINADPWKQWATANTKVSHRGGVMHLEQRTLFLPCLLSGLISGWLAG